MEKITINFEQILAFSFLLKGRSVTSSELASLMGKFVYKNLDFEIVDGHFSDLIGFIKSTENGYSLKDEFTFDSDISTHFNLDHSYILRDYLLAVAGKNLCNAMTKTIGWNVRTDSPINIESECDNLLK